MGLRRTIQKTVNSYKNLQEAKTYFLLGPWAQQSCQNSVFSNYQIWKNAFILLVSKFVEFDKVAIGKNVP